MTTKKKLGELSRRSSLQVVLGELRFSSTFYDEKSRKIKVRRWKRNFLESYTLKLRTCDVST